ncbi:MAG: hypothetical protein ABJL44_16720 [Algibacter sp.]
MKLYFSILCLTAMVCIGCKEDSKTDYAFLGGEIINATDNFVILSMDDTVVDTIKLDGNNRFIYKIDNLKTGFHTFKHGGELQMVLLEPNDSLMLRLNTYEFDESLVFTGIGAKKNNYFINEFLQNEIEETRVFKYCQLNSKSFSHRIDSIKSYKNKKLIKFQKKHSPSDLFIKIAQANIDYSYYASKEIYPFIHYGKSKCDIVKSLPKDFYAYRKDIDYNNDFHKDYFIYNNFLRSNLNNLALEKHTSHSDSDEFNRKSLCFNLDKLHLIDSIVKIPAVKNKLLFHNTFGFLSKNDNEKHNSAILKSFLQKSTSEENKTSISTLVIALNKLKAGNSFPNIEILDLKNGETEINTLINKPTAIYFWSHNFYDHFKDSHIKVNELKDKYPEIDFIAVNIDNPKSGVWMSSLHKNKFSIKKEYQLRFPKKALKILAIHPMTKVFVLDKDQKIVHSNTNMFASNFEEQLLALISK